MSVAKYIVNRSTTLIQIDSSQNQNAIVLLSSVNTPGTLVTIRDIAGGISYKHRKDADGNIMYDSFNNVIQDPTNNIVTISTMKDIYFIHKDLSDKPVSSILLSQPYGFITVSPKTPTLWAVINTQAFPDATTAGNLITLHASTSLLNEASISTCRISTLAANNISTMSLSAVSSIVQSNLYVPFIHNSSLFTSSVLTSSLTALNIYVSSIEAISTIIHSNLYVPFIQNSSLFTSSILTSTLTAGNIYVSSIQAISTTILSNLYVPQLQVSSIMASTIITSSITASTVTTSTLSAFITGVSGSLEISGTNVAPRIWVVVGEASGTNADADILYSTDGLTWVPATYDSSVTGMISLNDVCWNGSNRWVAVGKGGTHTILYSDDGMVWKATSGSGFSVGSSGGGNGISYNSVQGKWVAVGKGANTILYSTDGITWSSASVTGTTGFLECKGVANNGSRWMAVGKGTSVSNHILTSTDGLTWIPLPNSGLTSINALITDSYSDVIYAEEKTKWFVVGNTTNILNSIISITNDIYLTCAAISLGGFNGGGNSIAWNGCYFVAVGSDTTPAKTIQYSLDGSKWYPSFRPFVNVPDNEGSFNTAGYGVAWAENYFIAVGTDSTRTSRTIIYSADGKNWLSYDVTGNGQLTLAKGICYSRGSTGPLYALTIKGDAYIDGNLYITNGYPTSVNAITGSSGGSGAGGSSGSSGSTGPVPLRFVTDVSTMLAQFSSIGVGVKDPGYQIDVDGSINASSNILINGDKVTTENSLASTIEGLGSFTYISSLSLQSTVQSFMRNCSSLQANFSSIGVNCNSPNYDIDVIGDINYTGTLYRNGLEFTGSASIPGINSQGRVAINKTGLANAALDVSGQMVVSDYVTLNDDLDVSGKLMVNGEIIASSNLFITGNITATSNVSISRMLSIYNQYNAANNIPILGTDLGQTITPGIKVGILNIGAYYANNSPVIWSEGGLIIQASNGAVSIPRNDLSVGGGISVGAAELIDGPTTYNLSIPGGTNQRMGNLSLNSIQATGNIAANSIRANEFLIGKNYEYSGTPGSFSEVDNYSLFRGAYRNIPTADLGSLRGGNAGGWIALSGYIPPVKSAIYLVYVTRSLPGAGRGYSTHLLQTWDTGGINGKDKANWESTRISDPNNGFWDDYVYIIDYYGNFANLGDGYIASRGANSTNDILIVQLA